MTRTIDQVSQDLEQLQSATFKLDQELQELYQAYLSALGQATSQQLILAVYHLCTQVYPDEFLALAVAHREKLQSRLRQIAAEGREQLVQLGQWVTPPPPAPTDRQEAPEEVTQLESEADREGEGEEGTDTVLSRLDWSALRDHGEAAIAPEDPTETEAIAAAAMQEITHVVQSWGRSLSFAQLWQQETLSPVMLAKRHVLLERHLRSILQTLSNLTNYLLKQMQILPDFPDIVLATAAESAPEEITSTVPNLLNVLVEIGQRSPTDDTPEHPETGILTEESATTAATQPPKDETEEEQEATYLVVLNLRLADIEFADAYAALWRSKIQETLTKLKRLGSRYQTLQQEKARAEAEHAWRATWFEE